jgi:hypothetical protein
MADFIWEGNRSSILGKTEFPVTQARTLLVDSFGKPEFLQNLVWYFAPESVVIVGLLLESIAGASATTARITTARIRRPPPQTTKAILNNVAGERQNEVETPPTTQPEPSSIQAPDR